MSSGNTMTDGDRCRRCGDVVDLDGYDGLCGNCADIEFDDDS